MVNGLLLKRIQNFNQTQNQTLIKIQIMKNILFKQIIKENLFYLKFLLQSKVWDIQLIIQSLISELTLIF